MANTATPKPSPPELPGGLIPRLKTTELALLHHVSAWTVNKWVKQGCPFRRLPNGERRFDPPAVDEWLEAQSAGIEEFTRSRAAAGVAARASA